jgi:cytidylate kinase
VNSIIAIDGPAGAGKSTIAARVAARLGVERLDTGAMYRAVTLAALRAGVDPGDADAVGRLAANVDLEIGSAVLLDGEDVTTEIRSAPVNAVVSVVSANPVVRAELVRRQRAWAAEHGGGVVEGRDIGSVVFPDAKLKVFLTADPLERARRRAAEEGLAGDGSVAELAAQIASRDRLDSSRENSPLAHATGAHLIDSTERTIESLVEEVLALL